MKTQTLRLFAFAVAVTMLGTACTKPRNASFPDEQAESIFALSEFGTLDVQKTRFVVATSSENKSLSVKQNALASFERGLAPVDTKSLQVPERLKFMFIDLNLPGTANEKFHVLFGTDNKFVTAYKVVDSPAKLSHLEKALALLPSEVEAQIQLLKTTDAKASKALRKKASGISASKIQAMRESRASTYLVPIFKFQVKSYGVVERAKNEIKEETSVLKLRETDFSRATHVKISTAFLDRLPVLGNPTSADTEDEIFIADRVNKKLLTAGELKNAFGISSSLSDDTKVWTVVDNNFLRVFEVTSSDRLSSSEQAMLKAGTQNGQVTRCDAEIAKQSNQTNCVIVQRFTYGITHVEPSLKIGANGIATHEIDYSNEVPSKDSRGLIRIRKNQIPTEIVSNGFLDPRTVIRLSDVRGKEFFFRRTLSEATATGPFFAGVSGDIYLVKFEFEENRMVIRRTERAIDFGGDRRRLDDEEILSIPVSYFKFTSKDVGGNPLAIEGYKQSRLADAEFAKLNWSSNSISKNQSPLAAFGMGECVRQMGNENYSDVELALDRGALTFTVEYTANVDQRCLTRIGGVQGYNDGDAQEYSHQIKEIVSFKQNDSSTDKAFAPAVPFDVQRNLGYGAFTLSKVKPASSGLRGVEGTELNFPRVHDFRNGKVLTYILGGIPESEEGRIFKVENETIDLRELYIEVARETIEEWNRTLHRAFKGTPMERSGNYIEFKVNGEDGIKYALGDLTKNFIWFDETKYTTGILGISQNGVNPRSGISVADNVVMYPGVFKGYIDANRKRRRILLAFEKMAEDIRRQVQAQLAQQSDKSGSAATGATLQPEGTQLESAEKTIGSNLRKHLKNAAGGDVQKLLNLRRGQFDENVRRQLGKVSLPGLGSAQTFEDLLGSKSYVHTALKKALASSEAPSAEDLQSLMIAEALKRPNALTGEDRMALQQGFAELQQKQRLREMSRRHLNCAMTEGDLARRLTDGKSFRENLKHALRSTLAHEMGHALGLTHNFAASTDKSNFHFADESQDKVESASSVMDYVDFPVDVTSRPGPYDVHAIRASYTGLLETKNNTFVHVDAVKKAAGGQWTAVMGVGQAALTSKFNLKSYRYCTDRDVMWDVMCERHDFGSTPLELMKNLEQDYEYVYRTSFYGHDRLKFDIVNAMGAVARSTQMLIKARLMLDEAYFAAATGQEGQMKEFMEAAKRAHRFLLSVITAPDAKATFRQIEKRFVPIQYQYKSPVVDANGKPQTDAKGHAITEDKKDIAIVELKTLQTIRAGGADKHRVDTVGVDDLKSSAIMLLTSKGLPIRKFREQQILVSFADFERTVLKVENDMQSPVLSTLFSLLSGELRPRLSTEHLTLAPLPEQFTADITQAMRVQAAIGALANLDAGNVPDQFNFASKFKVLTVRGNAPTDRVSVTKLDSPNNSSQRVNYAANDNAVFADALVREAAFLRLGVGMENSNVLTEKIVAIAQAVAKDDSAALVTAQAGAVQALTQIGATDQLLFANPQMIPQGQEGLPFAVSLYTSVVAEFFSEKSELRKNAAMVVDTLRSLNERMEALNNSPEFQRMSPEQRAAKVAEVQGSLTQEQAAAIQKVMELGQKLSQTIKMAPTVGSAFIAALVHSQVTAKENHEDATVKAVDQVLQILAGHPTVGVVNTLQAMMIRNVELISTLDLLQKITRMTSPELFN